MVQMWVVGSKEEHVPSSFMFVSCVGELDDIVLTRGRLSLRKLGSLSSEKFVLKQEFAKTIDVKVSNWIDWLLWNL